MADAPDTLPPRRRDLVLIVAFAVVLCLPLIDSLTGIDRAPAVNENRAATPFPAYTGLSHLQNYIQGLQAWYDDHFGFRKRLVRWHSSWKKKAFREAAVREVIIGRDGWLYTAANGMIENHTQLKVFTDADLAAWQKLLETRRGWLAARGIRYQVVIAPDKHTLHPEHLPPWLKHGPGPSKLDRFLAHMHARSTVPVLDLRPVLRDAAAREPVFLMTDTHWNMRGAFLGAQALIAALAPQFPGLAPLRAEQLTWANQPGPGDLAIMLGQENDFPEQNRVLITGGMPPLQIERTPHPAAKRAAIITTRNPAATRKAIVYHDSFGDAWIPLLGAHFGEVQYISKRILDPGYIEAEKPDLVIDQIVERILNVKDPAQLLADDGFPPDQR